jgi:6-pyruvoyltetrahydropterin/6-carboxytetrahydropterin synthase
MLRVAMTRRVSFSSGHRYWNEALDEAGNRKLFGKWASRFNHGHNYALEVTVEGPVESRTGMVLNIKRIDDLLRRRITSIADGKSLNDEVPAFKTTPPTVENIMEWVWRLVEPSLPPAVELKRVRLEETPLIYGELEKHHMTLTRVYEFAASHRLDSPGLTPEENLELFGKCNNPAGHGHNYVLEVTVQGEPDEKTGMLADLVTLDKKVQDLVLLRYDHKNLNVDVPELRNVVPTSENVAAAIYKALEGKLPARLHRIRLYETARNMFEVTAN